MNETDPPPRGVETAKAEGASRRISAVWLVPLLALVIALAVAWQAYSERGPLIEIVFDGAEGIEAGATPVRFRDVIVGAVEEVGFTEDLRNVVVLARMDSSIAGQLNADAQFWVVRPSVSAQGISGIETVISGVYIEAYLSGEAGERPERYIALESPPLTPADQPGMRVRLRAPDGGSMTVGAPVLYNRIQVGQVETVELTDAGDVLIDVFVDAPHHLRLTQGTRFWNASGFSISLSGAGASLNVESLVSLLQGGVSFDTVGSLTEPVEPGHAYVLYDDETSARQNLFEDAPEGRLLIDTYFDGSVRGLAPGAPVEYRGLRVGEVAALQAAIVPTETGQTVALRATLAIVPLRLGIAEGAVDPAQAALELLDDEVAGGLRAQLASEGLLSTNLFVDLASLAEVAPQPLDRAAEPNPVIPSAPTETNSLGASAEGVLQRISALPVEDLLDNAVTLLASINSLVTDDAVRAAPENLGLLLADLRGLVADEDIQSAPSQIAAVLAAARGIVEDATERQLVAALADTLATTEATLRILGSAAEEVPGLIAEFEGLSTDARALPLEELVAAGTRLVDDADAFVRSENVAALPAMLNVTLGDLRVLLAQIREGEAVTNVTATLASLRDISADLAGANLVARIEEAVAAAESAAANVESASSDLPALVESLRAVSDEAASLPLEALVTRATAAVDSANALLLSDELEALPPRVGAALREVELILAELREGGAVNNVNSALASADAAAASISSATDELPALVAQLRQLAAQAEATLAVVGPNSRITADTEQLLREVIAAARSVNDLASALERRPNSVLFGR